MTLTTERQQFEEWFTKKYPRSHWGVEKTASGEYQGGLAAPLWEAWQESRGCMANREAQPVAWEMRYWSDGYNIWGDWERITEELHNRLSAEHATDNDYEFRALYDAPPAPAVPSEMTACQAYDLLMSKGGVISPVDSAVFAWNACRAAMLAQPVSSGYKLNSPEIPDGWKLMPLEMTDEIGEAIAMEARCCGGIALCIYEAALAAAPEGGN